MKQSRKRAFSVVKAVKRNSRERVGAVPPVRVLPDPAARARRDPKYRESVQELIERGPREL